MTPADPDLLAAATRMVREAHQKHPERLVWIYAIQAEKHGPVKIGWSRDPKARLEDLQRNTADELRGIAAWRSFPLEERQIHEDFAHARIRGEWFHPDRELLALVLALGGDFEDWE